MPRFLDPFRLVLIAVAGWMNQRHIQTIEYLREENRVLREQLGQRRVRLNDDQRRRLATKAKFLGRRLLAEVATIVTPETLSMANYFVIRMRFTSSVRLLLSRCSDGEDDRCGAEAGLCLIGLVVSRWSDRLACSSAAQCGFGLRDSRQYTHAQAVEGGSR